MATSLKEQQIDSLVSTAKEYIAKERTRLEDEAIFLKAIKKGSGQLEEILVDLAQIEVNQFLGES